MAKVHSKVKFDKSFPVGGFWRDNWLITRMVQVLQARETLTPEEDSIRLIIVKDTEQDTLFLQGAEVRLIQEILVDWVQDARIDLPDMADEVDKILDKRDETSTSV